MSGELPHVQEVCSQGGDSEVGELMGKGSAREVAQ